MLSESKLKSMQTAVQRFMISTVVGNSVVKVSSGQLHEILGITSEELKLDPNALISLQELLMLDGIMFMSLPSIQKSEGGKMRKDYYFFSSTLPAIQDAMCFSDQEFEQVIKNTRIGYADIANLVRLNLPPAELADLACKSLGHSRLSTSKYGKCARCGKEKKSGYSDSLMTVLYNQSGTFGNRKDFRSMDRLDWRDLIFMPPKILTALAASVKLSKIVDLDSVYDLLALKSDTGKVDAKILSESDSLKLHQSMTAKSATKSPK